MRTEIKSLYNNEEKYGGGAVTVCGWIRSIRISKNFGFVEVNDGSYFKNLQIIIEPDKLENYGEVSKLNVGAAIRAEGQLVLTPEAKQPFELKAEKVTVEGASSPDYPLQKKRHSFEFLRTIPHLRPRTNALSAVFRVRSMLAQEIHRYFADRGFVYAHTPIITGSDCEGAGEMFRVTTLEPGSGEAAENDFLRQACFSHGQRTAGGRGVRHGFRKYLHLRPHLPCGKQQHHPSCGGVLDDRAGNGVC